MPKLKRDIESVDWPEPCLMCSLQDPPTRVCVCVWWGRARGKQRAQNTKYIVMCSGRCRSFHVALALAQAVPSAWNFFLFFFFFPCSNPACPLRSSLRFPYFWELFLTSVCPYASPPPPSPWRDTSDHTAHPARQLRTSLLSSLEHVWFTAVCQGPSLVPCIQ